MKPEPHSWAWNERDLFTRSFGDVALEHCVSHLPVEYLMLRDVLLQVRAYFTGENSPVTHSPLTYSMLAVCGNVRSVAGIISLVDIALEHEPGWVGGAVLRDEGQPAPDAREGDAPCE